MKEDIVEIKDNNIEKKEFKLTAKMLSKISLVINKMGVSTLISELNENTGDEKKDTFVIVKKLLALIIDNLYKAEDEVIDFVAELKGISKEEAAKEDLIPIIKELINNENVARFLNLT